MEGSWRVRGGFVEGSWRVRGGFVEGSWRVRGGFVEGPWRVEGLGFVEGSWRVRGEMKSISYVYRHNLARLVHNILKHIVMTKIYFIQGKLTVANRCNSKIVITS